MKKKPVKVSVIGKKTNGTYQIWFPNLKIPVKVNEELYEKMLHSSAYDFQNQDAFRISNRQNSA